VLSQYVEERYATDLLSVQTSGVGYLLKDLVAQLLVRRRSDPIDRLTPRELEVLRLMAEGRSYPPPTPTTAGSSPS